jgi:S-adenosylmethionine synthetase
MASHYLFTSESVSEGHPDKVADTISDAVLDYVLSYRPFNHCACEVLITHGLVVVAGEVEWPSSEWEAFERSVHGVVQDVLNRVGYDSRTFDIQIRLNQQSEEICQGVRREDGIIGAGDQGLMFGYATNETAELMPLALELSHQLLLRHSSLRHSGALQWLRPDAKAQVTVRYEGARPVAVDTIVLSTQHAPEIDNLAIRDQVIEYIVEPVIPAELQISDMRILINPAGRFETGGPEADTGLTGRKIIVDTYGGACPHGGGAFSGKDPTKVDRSAAYMARYIAKNVVAAGIAERCTLQLAYAIGVAEPVSVYANLHHTGIVDESVLSDVIRRVFDLTPAGIISTLDLRRPIYQQTATYGHFGRSNMGFSWERLDQIDALLAHFPNVRGRDSQQAGVHIA